MFQIYRDIFNNILLSNVTAIIVSTVCITILVFNNEFIKVCLTNDGLNII